MNKTPIALLSLLAFAVYLLIAATTSSAPVTPQSDSETSTLTLVVLPAIETTTLSASSEVVGSSVFLQEITFALRANTPWDLRLSSKALGLSSQAQCETYGATGNRNRSDAFQTISIYCWQPISWADPAGPQTSQIIYQVSRPL